MRWGPGPVFVYESIAAARRWQVYALRAVFVLGLLVALGVVWESLDLSQVNLAEGLNRRQLTRIGQRFFEGLAGLQIAVVLLAAPAATAGAVCLDRARGTLTHVFVTDLSDGEIVVGKLAARLAPVVALTAAAVPVMALTALLGGIIPEAIATLFAVSVAVAVLGSSLALAVSSRVLKTHEVLMAVYTALAAWLLSLPVVLVVCRANGLSPPPAWFVKLNPFVLVYALYEAPGYVGWWDVALFLAGTAAASAGLVGFAVVRLRREPAPPAARRERWDRWASWVRARLFSWWPSPTLDGNPVLWREWHRNRPGRTARRVWGLFTALTLGGAALGVRELIKHGAVLGGPQTWGIVSAFSVTFGLLFLSVTAPTALSEERARGSLDVLMSTPLSTASIVLAKWWGAFRVVPKLAAVPAVLALLVAAAAPEEAYWPWMRTVLQPKPVPLTPLDRWAAAVLPVAWVFAHGAAVTSVGLALATWIARPGRAAAVSAAAFVTLTVGTIILAETVVMPLVRRNLGAYGMNYNDVRWVEQGLISLSPFGGQLTPLETLIQPFQGDRGSVWLVQAVLIVGMSGFAAVVLGLTVLTFNRCLGRVDETSVPMGDGR